MMYLNLQKEFPDSLMVPLGEPRSAHSSLFNASQH